MAIPPSIPFLEAAYRQRPQQPDTGGLSFMRAFERAQDRKAEEPQRLVQQQVAQLQLQKATIDLANATQLQKDRVAGEAALAGFSARVRQSILAGPSEPVALNAVIEYLDQNRGILQTVEGSKTFEFWEKAVEDDRAKKARLEAMRPEATPDPIEIAREISVLERQAEKARASGDTSTFQSLQGQIADIRAQVQKGGVSTRVEMDDQGRPVITTAVGGALPTIATRSASQQRLITFESALEGINDVMAKIRPEDVGVQGVVGENLFDKWIEQFRPGTANRQRVSNRTAARDLSEQLIAAISADTSGRFSDKDVARIREISSGLGASTSHAEFTTRLKTLREILVQRSRTFAEGAGQPVPTFAKSAQELQAEYEAERKRLSGEVRANRLTREQANARLQVLHEQTMDALKRFHGLVPAAP